MLNGGSGDVTAEVVFVGYGFDAAAEGRDDYAGVDVKGRSSWSSGASPKGASGRTTAPRSPGRRRRHGRERPGSS
jgi:hypothetical protein